MCVQKDAPEDIPNVPSFFHLLTLVGFSLFTAEQVDVLVLEVGMGGRLDATNSIKSPKVCGITKLDYDHQHILGDTLEEIAEEVRTVFVDKLQN